MNPYTMTFKLPSIGQRVRIVRPLYYDLGGLGWDFVDAGVTAKVVEVQENEVDALIGIEFEDLDFDGEDYLAENESVKRFIDYWKNTFDREGCYYFYESSCGLLFNNMYVESGIVEFHLCCQFIDEKGKDMAIDEVMAQEGISPA